MGFTITQRTFTTPSKDYPTLCRVAGKIYYAWTEKTFKEIWTGEMSINGSGFSATRRRILVVPATVDSHIVKILVKDNKIHYTWLEREDNNSYPQIWTATMNIDGTNWVATQRTTNPIYRTYTLQFIASDNKIHYFWAERLGSYYRELWTATMNLDGTNWVATKQMTTAKGTRSHCLSIENDKLYYSWEEYDADLIDQIWIASANLDGSGWISTQVTIGGRYKVYPMTVVKNSKLYYIWNDYSDDELYQSRIWIGISNLDGTGFVSMEKRDDYHVDHFNESIYAENNKIYYAGECYKNDDDRYDIWIASANLDGSGWNFEYVTDDRQSYEIDIFNQNFVFIRHDEDGYEQIWTGGLGHGKLKGWDTHITQGGISHKGVQASWYKPINKRSLA